MHNDEAIIGGMICGNQVMASAVLIEVWWYMHSGEMFREDILGRLKLRSLDFSPNGNNGEPLFNPNSGKWFPFPHQAFPTVS